MALETKFNNYGQEQHINNFDKLIKIGDKFLQVRLIETQWFKDEGFSRPMPRAKFVKPDKDFYYLVTKGDIIDLQKFREVKNQNERTKIRD
jgi:hypothetical protein